MAWKWVARVFRALVGVVAVVLAVALFSYLARTREQPAHTDTDRALPVVRAVECVERPIARRFTGYGTARAMTASDVAAQVAGRVVERPEGLEAGTAVEAGDVLVRLDPTDYEQGLRSARQRVASLEAEISGLEIEEARLEEQAGLLREELTIAERDLARARGALEAGAGNQSQVDARLQAVQAANRALSVVLSQLESIPTRRRALEASIEQARADVRLAEENLSRTEIRAPFTGTVQEVMLEEGEWANPGATVARVVDLSRIEVPVRLPAGAARWVRPGDAAVLRTEGASEASWPGEIVRVAPEADAATRSFLVFIEVRQRPAEDRADLLRPGQFLMGEVVSEDVKTRRIVPRVAVDVERVLVGEPLGPGAAAPAGAVRPMVVREAEVNVAFFLAGAFPEVWPEEREWAVLEDRGVRAMRRLEVGDLVLVSNLEMLRPGEMIDVRLPDETDGQAPAGPGERMVRDGAEIRPVGEGEEGGRP